MVIRREEIVKCALLGLWAVLGLAAGCVAPPSSYRTPQRDALIEEIRRFKGTPYVYGGSSPAGADCSGFTMAVFARFGKTLPHSASKQFKMGRPVARADLKMGDLVFFKTGGSKRVNHVGIHLWDGKMVHASSTYGVIVVKWEGNTYYERRYAGARRIVDF